MNLAEVRLQEGESIDNALRRFKRKVQTEDIIGSEAPLLLPEAGREAPGEASLGPKARQKEDSQRVGLSCSAVANVTEIPLHGHRYPTAHFQAMKANPCDDTSGQTCQSPPEFIEAEKHNPESKHRRKGGHYVRYLWCNWSYGKCRYR